MLTTNRNESSSQKNDKKKSKPKSNHHDIGHDPQYVNNQHKSRMESGSSSSQQKLIENPTQDSCQHVNNISMDGVEEEEEESCFICKQDGEVLLCDYPGCKKMYHKVSSKSDVILRKLFVIPVNNFV